MRSEPHVPITALQVVWAIFSAIGLVTVGWASAHVAGPGVMLAELRQTWGAATIALDLLFLGIPVVIFAVIEARRLGMRAPWGLGGAGDSASRRLSDSAVLLVARASAAPSEMSRR
jgi:hypothetical protein